MKLIGLTGKAQAGKDTVAKMLWVEYGFTRLAFADPLKQAAQIMFGLTNDQTWSEELKEEVIPYWGMSPRQIFQKLGTEACRDVFGPDHWFKRLNLQFEFLKHTDHVVITDVRFDNEAAYVRSQGGVIVQVVRGEGLSGSEGAHRSEAGLTLPPDYVIFNNGSLDDLRQRTIALGTEIGL